MRMLLATSPEGLAVGKVVKPAFAVQPLGLLYITAYLRKSTSSGPQVKLFDAYTLGASREQIAEEIKNFRPDVVGAGASTIMIYDAHEICSIAKQVDKSIKTVIGGPHITSDPASASHIDTDFGVLGEGELTLLELIEALESSGEFGNIKGLVWKNESQLVVNELREPVEDLDTLPFPDDELLMDKIYNPLPTWGTKGSFGVMITSRGCPYHCSYCSVTEAQGQKYRYHSANKVFEEVKRLNSRFGVTEISFRDGTFTTVKSRVYELCDLLLTENVKVRWTCNVRANELDEDLLEKMKEAGCTGIFLGIEHGNEQLMWKYKRLRKESVTEIVGTARKIGLDVQGYFMLGMPDESVDNIHETLNYARSLDLTTAAFTIATPFPGTKFYRYCKENHLLQHERWDKYDARLGLTWKHPTISQKEMTSLMKKMYRSFYLRPKIIIDRLKKLKNPRQLLDYMLLFKQFLK